MGMNGQSAAKTTIHTNTDAIDIYLEEILMHIVELAKIMTVLSDTDIAVGSMHHHYHRNCYYHLGPLIHL